jgi:hypothetical protein
MPRGPQVDKVPPLRLDLDFLDTSGFVVMPVETPAVPIDSRDASGDARPVEKLTVTQTLDERRANTGVLILEVKAVGVGLIPELNDLCTVQPAGFEIVKTDDQGVAVKKFEEDAEKNGIVSERTWELTLKAKDGQTELPKTFTFAAVKVPAKEVIYQRYSDADLTAVGQEVSLDNVYGKPRSRRGWYIAAVAVALLIVVAGVVLALSQRKKPVISSGLPERLDPFTAAALLREARERPELTPESRAELERDLAAIEYFHFSDNPNGQPAPELKKFVEKWATTVPGRVSTSRGS